MFTFNSHKLLKDKHTQHEQTQKQCAYFWKSTAYGNSEENKLEKQGKKPS